MTKLRAFTMPKWGIEMVEGTVAEWMVGEGAGFRKGELLTLIETDKIANEVEAEFDAEVARIVVAAGETVPVGALLAVFAEGAADPAAVDEFVRSHSPAGGSPAKATPSAPPPPPPPPAPAAPAAPPPIPDGLAISPAARALAGEKALDVRSLLGSGRGGRITYQDVDQAAKPAAPMPPREPLSIAPTTAHLADIYASPLAKRLATAHEVDLTSISGTGSRGRICKADVIARIAARVSEASAAPAPSAAAPGTVEVVKMSPIRKAIARQLTLSKSTIPHFYLRRAVRVDAVLAFREDAKRATGEAPSLNDYLIRACALALARHPDVNVQVHGEEIHRFADADIAVAVATGKGLITPIIRGAQAKNVAQISREMKALAERARQSRLAAEEFQGGSFSISNLGMFGIDDFDAIINPPQGAILAAGAARQEPIASNYALAFATRLQLTLSCDHRAIDGAVGARFLAELAGLLENPESLRP